MKVTVVNRYGACRFDEVFNLIRTRCRAHDTVQKEAALIQRQLVDFEGNHGLVFHIEDLNPAFLRTQARSKHVVLRKYGNTRIEITNHTVAHIFHSELENRHPPSRERFYSLPVCVLNHKIANLLPTRPFSKDRTSVG